MNFKHIKILISRVFTVLNHTVAQFCENPGDKHDQTAYKYYPIKRADLRRRGRGKAKQAHLGVEVKEKVREGIASSEIHTENAQIRRHNKVHKRRDQCNKNVSPFYNKILTVHKKIDYCKSGHNGMGNYSCRRPHVKVCKGSKEGAENYSSNAGRYGKCKFENKDPSLVIILSRFFAEHQRCKLDNTDRSRP